MTMGLFDSVKGEMIHYFIRPHDDFILNTLEKVDASTYLYRVLREEGYQQIFFVSIEETNYSVLTYDRFSYWATIKPLDFSRVDINDEDGMNAFLGVQGAVARKPGGMTLNTKFNRRPAAQAPAQEDSGRNVPVYGKSQLQTFASQEEFVEFFLNRVSPAINSDKVKTAVVIPMAMFELTGKIALTVIDKVIINTIRNAQKNNRAKRNIIILTAGRQDDLAVCMEIPEFSELHYWVPSVLKTAKYQDDRVALAVSVLQEEGILVLADDICEDEIANLLIRKKLVECDPRFEELRVSRVYRLAELLAEQCRMEHRHFQSFAPFRMKDHIRQLNDLLSRDAVIAEVVAKSRELKDCNTDELRNICAVELERVTHRHIERHVRSREEIMADYREAMQPLNDLIGLGNVKSSIELHLNSVLAFGGTDGPGNYIFAGNPGTGKTEVARLMGNIFKALGLLRKGHLVECRKADLVAEHVGGSAIKTKKKCMEALDGVLFVDEAYELVNLEPTGTRFATQFDAEAYTEIMTFMENNRHRVCVIFAGYRKEMEIFRNANPGMPQRLPESNIIEFTDYSAEELYEIFALFARKDTAGSFTLTEEFSALLRETLKKLTSHKSQGFGNARQMRVMFGLCKKRAGQRSIQTNDDDSKFVLQPEDMPEEYNMQFSEEEYARAMAGLNELIGLENVKTVIRRLLNKKLAYGGNPEPGHYIFAGNPGTGKTEVARLMGRILKAQGLLSKGHVVECKAADLVAGYTGQTGRNVRAICESALDGVLFVDEAYSLVNTEPTGGDYSSSFAKEAYEEIMTFMENNRHRVCVIFAGYQKEMLEFVQANPGMDRRITATVDFPDYSVEELWKIFELFAKKEGFTCSDEFTEKIRTVIRNMKKTADTGFGNAGAMRKLMNSCKERASDRFMETKEEASKFLLLPVDIPEEYLPQASEAELEKALRELNELIGLESVKNTVNELVSMKKIYQDEQGTGHFVFSGNPGTGKTEVARKMGKIFKAMGLLSKGHVIECNEADLIGEYSGQTASKVRNVCRRALGGVLFVDEAYRLINTEPTGQVFKSSFAEEAYTEIMTFMENNRHRVCVIFAGYTDLMNKFLDANDGMRSRVNHIIDFPDYTDEELLQILKFMAVKEGYSFAPGFDEAAVEAIAAKKMEVTGKFANAREMRNLLAEFKKKLSVRMKLLYQNGQLEDVEQRKYLLTPEDTLVGSRHGAREDISVAMEDLNALIGLDGVKRQIRKIKNRIQYAANPDAVIEPGHYVFAGNPGTGKTEVARLMGRIFKAMGVLTRGHVVEVGRSDLVAGYIGQTAIKTMDRCKEALGGVLFVDEAYTLFDKYENDFGHEALDTILKFMEDNRKKLCVIFAGYEDRMTELMKVNAGFDSRIKEIISFPDYSQEEMKQILRLMAGKAMLECTEEFVEEAGALLSHLRAQKKGNFGNAREVRKLLDSADERRADRIGMLLEQGTDPASVRRNLLTVEDLDLSYKQDMARKPTEAPEEKTSEYHRIAEQELRILADPYDGKVPEDKISLGKATDPSVLFVHTDRGEGTAFLISPEGYALTCNHVIEGAKEIHARFRMPGRPGQEDTWHKCQVVNTKSDLDIALLKLEGSNFPYLKLATPDREIQKGEEFLLSGYPFGRRTAKDLTTFYGYVASSDKQKDENGLVRFNINSEAKSGNSGAPVIAMSDGCVIGILLGSMNGKNRDLIEEINYMRPIWYFWEEFLE